MFLFLLLFNMSITCANAVGVIVMKYGYGEIYWGKKAFTADPMVYPLNESSAYERLMGKQSGATIADLYPNYDIGEAENKQSQKVRAIDVSLKVRQASSNILVTITFHNKSNKNYFINGHSLPTETGIAFSLMCGSSFLITTNDIKLDYLGRSCDFGDDLRNGWNIIEPGKHFSFTVPLNFAYEFLPGKHQYQIGSLEYAIATEQWFDEKIMFNTMFRVFEIRSTCPIKADLPLVFEERWLCPQYNVGDGVRDDLEDMGFNGDSGEYYFEIRTNQVSISIDADKNTSYHQYLKKIREKKYQNIMKK
ncbi:transposase [Buttiauxella sp. A2-C2_NF]|uniref:transposase n=1 Tax=Buttiauxella ferragutiae TaxID=82989 RepID=UPI001E31F285|nr:transposase [Buttiauxella ferragutiae]